jgi:hypothetical protein
MTTAAAMIFFFLVCHAVAAQAMPNPLPKDSVERPAPKRAPWPILTLVTVILTVISQEFLAPVPAS